MTEYEILRQIPSGLKVRVYYKNEELMVIDVPAAHCQTRSLLENYIRRYSAEKIQEKQVPADVLGITGRQPLG